MRHLLSSIVVVAVSLLVGCSAAQPLVVCGWDEVLVINVTKAEQGDITKLWSWRAKDRPELPVTLSNAFRTTDDCKPVFAGKKILISSSSGGCALVEYPAGRVVWYAAVPNAHSVELLPGDRIIAAASVSPKGNRLMLFDIARSDQVIWEAPLHSAHGVVWDERRHVVWALGFDELRCYELQDWATATPALKLRASHKLPDDGGHDLQAVPGGNDLVVTTHNHVHLFDREKLTYRLHPELGDLVNVKCVSTHPESGRVAHLRGEGKNWWTERINLLAPAGEVNLPGEKLYKARWLTP